MAGQRSKRNIPCGRHAGGGLNDLHALVDDSVPEGLLTDGAVRNLRMVRNFKGDSANLCFS
jgi:hypothetical protein